MIIPLVIVYEHTVTQNKNNTDIIHLNIVVKTLQGLPKKNTNNPVQ